MITLDLRTLLPLTRKAFDEGRLQAQTGVEGSAEDISTCLYAGPCAIGVAIDAETATKFDRLAGGASIHDLIIRNLVSVPSDQMGDFVDLQVAHDEWVGSTDPEPRRAEFVRTLTRLEAKYVAA